MRKALIVARTEYVNAVTSKVFIIGMLLMPVLMGGVFIVQHLTKDQVDVSDRRVAIVDQTDKLFAVIAARADQRNASGIFNDNSVEKQIRPKFIFEEYRTDASDSERIDVVLSKRVNKGDLFAFVVIGQDVFSSTAPDGEPHPVGGATNFVYHTATPSYAELPRWLEQVVNAEIRRVRLAQLNITPAAMDVVNQRLQLRQFGLVERAPDGSVAEPREENRIYTIGIPMAGLMLLYMMLMTVAPSMLNNVLEEKMQKISEFLVSSIPPFQLMLGKLLGTVAVALTLAVLYLLAAYAMAVHFEVTDRVPASLYVWFMVFLLLAFIIYGSVYSAIGAACSEIRDAQGLMTPVMLMVIIPMFCVGPVFQSPSSLFSRLISLIPPATPLLMFLRIAIPPGPPAWEIALGFTLSCGFAMLCVWAGGKVFRIGVLSQGQTVTFGKIAQWVFSKS